MNTSADEMTTRLGFRWGVFAAALLAATAGHWLALALLHLLLHEWLHWPSASLVFASSSLAASFLLAWAAARLRHSWPWPRGFVQTLPQVLLAWSVFVGALWFAVTSEALLDEWIAQLGLPPAALIALIGLVLLALSLPLYERLLEEIEGVRNIRPQRRAELVQPEDADAGPDAEAMVLFLSTPSIVPEILPGGGTCHARVELREGQVATLAGEDAEADIEAIDHAVEAAGERPWNWQQLLRALRWHPRLRDLWIIASTDAPHYRAEQGADPLAPGARHSAQSGKGSWDFAELCREFLAPYTGARIHIATDAVGFEHYEEVMLAARHVLREHLRRVAAERIVVDITGGTKITSIAGAALTLNRGVSFQYVDTQPPHRVISFLLATEEPPGLHGH
jgi:hypothetical protein